MRILKWIGLCFLSYIALMIFSAVFMGGAYLVVVPFVAPIVASIVYRATTPAQLMDTSEYEDM